MNLKNKVVVITGSTRGFGRAIAEGMLAAGARVVVSGRKQTVVDAVVAELDRGKQVLGQACDVSVADQVYALAQFAIQEFGQIDIWINNAGITPMAGGILDFAPEVAEQTFRVNCVGTLNGTQAAIHVMKPLRRGTIVNLYGRGSDLNPATPSGLYGATKAWITSFTRTMAKEYGDLGVQFVGFSPGMMLTDMLDVQEVVGEQVAETMKNFPMVLEALGSPPEVPARELVHLLETNEKPFVEYKFMRGMRLIKMMAKFAWMGMNKNARPAPQEFDVLPAFEVPLGPGNEK
ncbi:SDR family oxidoreductase [bacterium]|nr:SDR family oxidoreductase [bacterium]